MEYALFPINHAAGHVLGAFGVDSLAGGGDGESAAGDGYILGGLDGVVARGDADIAARDVHIALVGLILVVGFDGVLAGGQGDGAVLDGHGIVALQGVFDGGYGDDAARDAQVVLGADAVVLGTQLIENGVLEEYEKSEKKPILVLRRDIDLDYKKTKYPVVRMCSEQLWEITNLLIYSRLKRPAPPLKVYIQATFEAI